MNKKVLILGYKSYISSGLIDKLQKAGFQVTCFSRGEEQKKDNIITGNVFNLSSNRLFDDYYDVVINFILLKDKDIAENIRYIESVSTFCELKNVKRLIHISSISVYANNEKYVNETTPIETNSLGKGTYAAQKIEVDKYLLSVNNPSFELCLVRPGFVVSDEIKSPLSGIAIQIPFNCCILLGNKSTSLPLIERNILQTALVEIIRKEQIQRVYLLLKNNSGTKYQYVKDIFHFKVISLPKFPVLFAASTLKCISVLDFPKYQKIKGLFKNTYFDSSQSEEALGLKF
jgi:NAD dependent epimerase/dehydratase family enzyme